MWPRVDGGPGPALGPSRSAEYRTVRHPLSTAVSASPPARLPASVPPHAEPFALRSDQGALLCLPPTTPLSHTLSRLSVATPLHVTHSRSLSLSSASPPLRVSLSHLRRRRVSHSNSLPLRLYYSGGSLRPTLSHRGLSSSSSGSRVTLGERTRAPAIILSLSDLGRLVPRLALVLSRFPTSSLTPSLSFCPSSSYVFSLPPNPPPRHSTLPPRSARDSAVSVAPRQPTVLPLVPQLLSRPFVPLFSLSLRSNAGVYSRCHLIAGRFSRVRYRSATESTQSAGARSCSGSSFSLSFSLFLSVRLCPRPFSIPDGLFFLARSAFYSF